MEKRSHDRPPVPSRDTKITTVGAGPYRFIVDMGSRPTAACINVRETYDTSKEARDERSKIIADRSRGTLVKPTKITVKQAIDKWLDGRRNLRTSTVRNYRDSLGLVTTSLGHIQLQALSKTHLDRLVTDLLDHGRRVGNVQQRGSVPGRSI